MDRLRGVVDVLLSEEYSLYRNIAAVVGAGYLLKIVSGHLWGLVSDFRAYWLAPWGISRVNLRKYGNWASELLDLLVSIIC